MATALQWELSLPINSLSGSLSLVSPPRFTRKVRWGDRHSQMKSFITEKEIGTLARYYVGSKRGR
jgi:hypothetical protein